MILSAQSIRSRCLASPPMIYPFTERGVKNGSSFGLSACSYDVRIDMDLVLAPGAACIASTVEDFHMPLDVAGFVVDKSTYARVFVSAFNTLMDPGWYGNLTLELANLGSTEVRYRNGDPVAQIVFHLLDQPTELPYRGKYQAQERGPQPARHES
jgi:dCTP deaminase